MADWMIWLILAGILVGLEIFTGTFYLLMVGVGFAAGAVTALAGGGKPAQFIIAAIIGVFATVLLRRKRGVQFEQDAASDPNVNIDIGQTITIDEWHRRGDNYTSRAMYRGSMWDVDLMHGSVPCAGEFIIREVRGSRLLVAAYSLDIDRKEA